MNDKNINTLLRILALVGAVVVWAISVKFNMLGFEFEVPGMAWASISLALVITVVEVVGTKTGMTNNLTMRIIWMSAYAYGITTNVIGLLASKGVGGTENWLTIAFALAFAVLMEVGPEPLFMWALVGEARMSDPAKQFYEWVTGNVLNLRVTHTPSGQRQAQNQPQGREARQAQSKNVHGGYQPHGGVAQAGPPVGGSNVNYDRLRPASVNKNMQR